MKRKNEKKNNSLQFWEAQWKHMIITKKTTPKNMQVWEAERDRPSICSRETVMPCCLYCWWELSHQQKQKRLETWNQSQSAQRKRTLSWIPHSMKTAIGYKAREACCKLSRIYDHSQPTDLLFEKLKVSRLYWGKCLTGWQPGLQKQMQSSINYRDG